MRVDEHGVEPERLAAGIELAGDVQAQLEHGRQLDRAAANDHDQRVGKLEQQPEVEPDDRRDADVQPGDGEGRADDVLAGLALEDRAESGEHNAGTLDRVVREQGVERAPIGEPRVQGVLVDPAVDPDDAADGAESEAERELDRRQEMNAEHDDDRRRPVRDVEAAKADHLRWPKPDAERARRAVAVPHERPGGRQRAGVERQSAPRRWEDPEDDRGTADADDRGRAVDRDSRGAEAGRRVPAVGREAERVQRVGELGYRRHRRAHVVEHLCAVCRGPVPDRLDVRCRGRAGVDPVEHGHEPGVDQLGQSPGHLVRHATPLRLLGEPWLTGEACVSQAARNFKRDMRSDVAATWQKAS